MTSKAQVAKRKLIFTRFPDYEDVGVWTAWTGALSAFSKPACAAGGGMTSTGRPRAVRASPGARRVHVERLSTTAGAPRRVRGRRPVAIGPPSLKEFERENRKLKRTNEILRKASAYFVQAELDRRGK